ncbi:shikimate dehydrogenase, partial [Candidatus Gottesmanbacteria bacterium]|nr:shikimate dehydrogenase [Candidatus Gottesmanbacteria bacterium]
SMDKIINNINGDTKIIGFLGSTYKTSRMYALYNAAFKALQLNYVYIPFVVNDLKKALEGICHLGIKAVGVTIPFKIEVIKYLDELDENAKRIGAVNIIMNDNGKLIGGNTDGLGGVKAINETISVADKKVVLIGAGGAARALAFAISDAGGKLTILNRTLSDASDLARKIDARSVVISHLSEEISESDIIINATSVGMKPNNDSLVDINLLHKKLTVMDVITNPKDTKLIMDAKKIGCKIVYGDRMLFWQAVLKFKMFTGIAAPVKVMEEEIKKYA